MSQPDAQTAFGLHLSELRRDRGHSSQERFAYRAGIDRTYYRDLERGEANPSLKMLIKLAEALRVQPSELLSVIRLEFDQDGLESAE